MVAKRFFYVCAGLLCLVAVYHLGARSATAQASASGSIGHVPDCCEAFCTPSGDVWLYQFSGWQLRGNVFNGNPAGRVIMQFDGSEAMASNGEVFSDIPNHSAGGPWGSLGFPPVATGAKASVGAG